MTTVALAARWTRQACPASCARWCARKKTGPLRFTRGRVVKTVYLSEGRLIFATSTDPDDRLGEMLLRKGLITYRALEESVQAIQAGKRQGTPWWRAASIRSRDLVQGVTEQVQEIIYGLFHWEEGECEFEEGDLPSREVIVLRMSTGDLLREGIRRVERWSRIRPAWAALEPALHARPPDVHRHPAAAVAHQGRDEPGGHAGRRHAAGGDLLGLAAPTSACAARCGGCGRRASWTACPRTRRRVAARETQPTRSGWRAPRWAREVDRFNQLHRFLFELVTYDLRERAADLFEQAFLRVAAEHAALFEGVAVDAAGELDAIALRHNVITREIARYLQGLDRLLDLEVALARDGMGERRPPSSRTA